MRIFLEMVIIMIDKLLQQEAYLSYKFLIDHTVFDEHHPGCGLTIDRTSRDDMATIAASGFMLSGLVIGVERGWDTYETNLHRAYITLNNFYIVIYCIFTFTFYTTFFRDVCSLC